MKREMASSLKLGLAIGAVVLLVMVVISSEARELRPSDHGLVYYPSTGNTSEAPAEAKSFFSGGGGESSSSSSGGGGVALPKAMNSNDTSWWEAGEKGRGGGRRDQVRDVLVVVSLVCGITGVVLFVASAFVYVLKHHRRHSKPEAASPSS